jgi:hypothetical protein
MTKDSLVGGVYYVHIPPNSGDLVLYDPRGMSPMLSANLSEAVRHKAEVGEWVGWRGWGGCNGRRRRVAWRTAAAAFMPHR